MDASDFFVKIPLNALGRDFVVGDIHGAYSLLARAMSAVGFDAAVDRLFSVGDLIDRGPDSARALGLLGMPGVLAIRGNHDNDFAGLSLSGIRELASLNWNGMGWALHQPDQVLLAMQAAFAGLPVAMEIQTERGAVGLVHGEVPIGMGWAEFTQLIQEEDPYAIESALWGRDRSNFGDASGVLGIDRIFCGHTVQWGGPRRLGNVHFVDTGAVFRELGYEEGAMTLANLACSTQAIAAPATPHPDAPGVHLFPLAGSGPFSTLAFDPFEPTEPSQPPQN